MGVPISSRPCASLFPRQHRKLSCKAPTYACIYTYFAILASWLWAACLLACMANMAEEGPAPRFGKPIAVPANKSPVLELLPMHAAAVPAKLGGQLMRALGAAAPLGQRLHHVKRVRKLEQEQGPPQLEILLCSLDWRDDRQESGGTAGQAQPAAQGAEALQGAAATVAGRDAQMVRPLLPAAVDALVRQHGLEPYTVQVRGPLLPGSRRP